MSDIRYTWIGHGTAMIGAPDGRTILLDPWVAANPACPPALKEKIRPDAMLITHGHGDHIGDAVALAKAHHPEILSIFEIGHWLGTKGVEKVRTMNKGGSQMLGDIRVSMVHADHSCGIVDDGKMVYGGEPCGYVLRFPDGFTLYFAGDTNVFGDMRLIAELHRPDVAVLPIGDLFTMGPDEAALAARMLGAKRVIPMHWGTFPALTGTPEALAERIRRDGIEVVPLKAGETTTLGK